MSRMESEKSEASKQLFCYVEGAGCPLRLEAVHTGRSFSFETECPL
jgi:hypothetical protein